MEKACRCLNQKEKKKKQVGVTGIDTERERKGYCSHWEKRDSHGSVFVRGFLKR